MNTQATATLHMKLKADSGYTSEESYRITPEQWGDVLRVVAGQLSSKPEQIGEQESNQSAK